MKKALLSLLLTLLVGAVWAQTPEEKPLLTIGCLSDVHCMNNMITPASGLLSDIRVRTSMTQVLDRMKQEDNVDVIVLGGDCQSDKTIDEGNAMMVRHRIAQATRGFFPEGKDQSVIWVTGNHDWEVANFDAIPKPYLAGDFYRFPMKEDIGILPEGDAFYEKADNGSLGQVELLAAYHYVLYGFDFVVLNCGKNFFKSAWDYTYSKESAEWVKAKMDEIYADDPNKTVFFCLHIPFQDSNSINSGKGMVESSDAVKILKACFSEHPNLIMLYGHDHGKDNAYIRTHTSQRVTLYDTAGKVISTTDATHFDGDVENPGPTPDNSTGKFYIYSETAAKHLTIDSYNLGLGDKYEYTVSGVNGLFTITTTYGTDNKATALHIGSSGRWSRGEASNLYIYDADGKRVSSVEDGKSYYIVAFYSNQYYALKAAVYSAGSDAQRMQSSIVDLTTGQASIESVPGAEYLWTFNACGDSPEPKPEEKGALSNVAFKSKSGSYFGIGSSDVAVLSEPYGFSIKDITGVTGAYYLYSADGSYIINTGSNGYLSKAASSQTNNLRYYYFYEATISGNTVTAKRVERPELGKDYIVCVANINTDPHGLYAIYCSLASGKDNRFDVVKINSSAISGKTVAEIPETITLTTSNTSSNGPISLEKVVWTLEDNNTDPNPGPGPDPKPTTGDPSFFSAFMGSLRYYYNTFDAGDPADMPTVVQALLVYVYKDRVVLQMKNYNQTGVIKGIEIAELPASYTSLREVTHSEPVTYVKGEKTPEPKEPEAEDAPAFPLENHPYAIKHVETGYYLNVIADNAKATILGKDPETFRFTWRGVGTKGFSIKNDKGYYIGGHSNTWNMSSSVPEYWSVEEQEGGYYAFGCTTAGKGKHIGFDEITLGSPAYRDKYVATEHGKFEIIDLEPSVGLKVVDSYVVTAPSAAYDLQGRSVRGAASVNGRVQHGCYIQAGRKILR